MMNMKKEKIIIRTVMRKKRKKIKIQISLPPIKLTIKNSEINNKKKDNSILRNLNRTY